MSRTSVRTEEAPQAIGPYSQAIVAGGVAYLSGQIPLDAAGSMVGGDDVEAQTEQVMQNLGAVLRAAGTDFGHVLKATIFLTDLGDFAAVNQIYARSFEGAEPPARACVQVAALPKGAKVEIDAIAAVP